jgi:hypothetical protein
MADGQADVILQVERDATSITYTASAARHELACMIFTIALNRETKWAKNPGMFPRTRLQLTWSPCFTGRTWRGQIGVKFDTSHPHWSSKTYADLLASLTSVFIARDQFVKR